MKHYLQLSIRSPICPPDSIYSFTIREIWINILRRSPKLISINSKIHVACPSCCLSITLYLTYSADKKNFERISLDQRTMSIYPKTYFVQLPYSLTINNDISGCNVIKEIKPAADWNIFFKTASILHLTRLVLLSIWLLLMFLKIPNHLWLSKS